MVNGPTSNVYVQVNFVVIIRIELIIFSTLIIKSNGLSHFCHFHVNYIHLKSLPYENV